MQTMTNYSGVLLRALAAAGAVVGLVAALADAAVAAPAASVTITERTAAAVEKTAKAPRVMADVQPSTFILDTAAQRLRQHAQKAAAVKDAGKSVVKAAVTAAPPTRTAAKAAPVAPHLCPAKAAPRGVVRLAQAHADRAEIIRKRVSCASLRCRHVGGHAGCSCRALAQLASAGPATDRVLVEVSIDGGTGHLEDRRDLGDGLVLAVVELLG